jgi:hypothetical protein
VNAFLNEEWISVSVESLLVAERVRIRRERVGMKREWALKWMSE